MPKLRSFNRFRALIVCGLLVLVCGSINKAYIDNALEVGNREMLVPGMTKSSGGGGWPGRTTDLTADEPTPLPS